MSEYREVDVAFEEGNKKKYKNKARCTNCGDIIESKYRHNFVQCSCFSVSTGIFLDGGNTYWRCGGNFSHLERIKEKLK